MGDHHGGQPQLVMDAPHVLGDLVPGQRVQRPERFVQQQDGRPGRQRPGQGHPLPLAAAEFGRHARPKTIRVQPYQSQEFPHPRGGAGRLPAPQPRRHGDVAGNGQVRKKSSFLRDIAYTPAQGGGVSGGDVLAPDPHRSAARFHQPVDQSQGRGLAAAGRSDQGQEFPIRDRQCQALQGGRSAAGIALGHALDFDHRQVPSLFGPAILRALAGKRKIGVKPRKRWEKWWFIRRLAQASRHRFHGRNGDRSMTDGVHITIGTGIFARDGVRVPGQPRPSLGSSHALLLLSRP